MRRLIAVTAGIVLMFTTSSGTAAAWNNSTEYVCNMYTTPAYWVTAYAGDQVTYQAYQWICSRATHEYLRDEASPVLWESDNTNVATVGSAAYNPTSRVTVTALNPGYANITAIARGASYYRTDVRAGNSLEVYPRPLSVSMSGPSYVLRLDRNPCTWYANVDGGVPPYRYAWYRTGSLVGTSSYYSRSGLYYNILLEVRVTDATGASVSTSKFVTTTTNYEDHC